MNLISSYNEANKEQKAINFQNRCIEIVEKYNKELKSEILLLNNQESERINYKFISVNDEFVKINDNYQNITKIIKEEKELHFKDKGDFKILFSKMKQVVDKLDNRMKTEFEAIDSYKTIIPAILDDLKMQHVIELQNEIDKKSISLVGIKNVKIANDQTNDGKPIIALNKKCVNCSQNPSVIYNLAYNFCI